MRSMGPRPLSIRLFAVACVLAAVISLVRGLLDPFAAQGELWFYTGMMLGEDAVIVTQFSLFTIALIPIFWVYFVASPLARWIVVGFGLLRLWPYAINPGYVPTAMLGDPIELAAPLLQIIAIVLLFTQEANRWFAPRETRPATGE